MSEILVLVDHVDGAVRKTTNELLTIARRLGEPSAVFIPLSRYRKFTSRR
jgi:electron transfer flavoprotein alpha subunit